MARLPGVPVPAQVLRCRDDHLRPIGQYFDALGVVVARSQALSRTGSVDMPTTATGPLDRRVLRPAQLPQGLKSATVARIHIGNDDTRARPGQQREVRLPRRDARVCPALLWTAPPRPQFLARQPRIP